MSVKFDIPDNYLDYRQYFSIYEERSFDMLIAYIETWHTYQVIWDNNWISKERVRQCLNALVKKLKILQNTMKNPNMFRTKQTTLDFVDMLSKFREWMEAERLTMAENEFAKKYNVCYSTVCKYMWFPKTKNLPRGKEEVKLDPLEVNIMRQKMSDTELIAHFKTSWGNINRQCWTRNENWIGKVARSRVITKKINEGNDRGLKSDNWEYPEPTNYELSWRAEAVDLEWPHKGIFDHMKIA